MKTYTKNSHIIINGQPYIYKKYSDSNLFEDENSQILDLITNIKQNNLALQNSDSKFFRDITPTNAGKKLYEYLSKSLYENRRRKRRINGVQVDLNKIINILFNQE